MLEAQGNKPVDAKTRARYEAQAKILKALAHPSRLFIIDELARSGPRCVCELTSLIGADMSSVSRHLSVLRDAGLVDLRKRGAQIWYSLSARCVVDFFHCIESVLQHKLCCQREALER